VWRGLGWLAQRYEVRFDRGIFARNGYLAGDDARRHAELNAALTEADVAAVLCARGGYGILRYAHLVDWEALRQRPRWIVGFSDVTALHVEAARAAVASLHACHVTALGRSDARSREALVQALEQPRQPRLFAELETWREGRATGPLFGGNLTILHACAAAGRLRIPPGAVLLIEDVGERPYRLDRVLTTLCVGGHLDTVAAVVVGELSDCVAGPDGVSALEVMRRRLSLLGVPLVCGAPVGHGLRNEPVVLGAPARVIATARGGQLEIFPTGD
jgi:muramoyltetrapeptide carboxypeptidase